MGYRLGKFKRFTAIPLISVVDGVLFAFLAVLLLAVPAAAEIYKWVDGKGRVHFQDYPPTSTEVIGKVESRPSAPPPTQSPTPDSAKPADQAAVASPKKWALATTAQLHAGSGDKCDLLGGHAANENSAKAAKATLRMWWGITDRSGLLDTLEWLEDEGHRRVFDKLAAQSASQLAAYHERVAADPEERNRVDVVLKYSSQLGGKGILAWDLVRYVNLCRQGYLAGLLSEPEAWERVLDMAVKLQGHFSSWKELGENYLIGREFWSSGQTRLQGEGMRRDLVSLCTEPQSPWVTIPWDMDLR
jgi:hypothetical protein